MTLNSRQRGTEGRVSVGLTISKSLADRNLNASLTGMISQNQVDKKRNGNLLNLSANVAYMINKKNSLSLRIYYFDNNIPAGNGNHEVRGNVMYGWRF